VFADEARIIVRAGKGGDGSVHFRREKFVPLGGPDGGDGGRGGSIYFAADESLNSLLPFVFQSTYTATPGEAGGRRKMHGAKGKDLTLRVPPGTVIRHAESGEVLADIVEPGKKVLVARGGRGGLGNTHFVTATRQAPRVADRGEPGEELALVLELKLIAEVGIIGLPNAGKSTLLSVVSAATPKIANYPFTTLQPELGVAQIGDRSLVFADIPGIIEGAHKGIGLGHAFLRHVERTRVLVHVVDGSGQEGRNPLDDVHTINEELRLYSPALAARPQIVAVNKMDIPEAVEHWSELRRQLGRNGTQVLAISGATRQGIPELLTAVTRMLDRLPTEDAATPALEPVRRAESAQVVRVDGHWEARGSLIDRVVAMTDLGSPDGVERLRRRLVQIGIEAELHRQGAQQGDVLVASDSRWKFQFDRIAFVDDADDSEDNQDRSL